MHTAKRDGIGSEKRITKTPHDDDDADDDEHNGTSPGESMYVRIETVCRLTPSLKH